MSNCHHCNTQLFNKTKFCHNCGTKVNSAQATVPCTSCNTINPAGTSFCLQCGANVEIELANLDANYKTIYPLTFKDIKSLPAQINTHFLKVLQARISSDYPNTTFTDYVDIFHESDFKPFFDQKAYLLAEATYTIHAKQMQTEPMDIDILLKSHFDRLLNHFLSQYCQKLTGESLPSAVSFYDDAISIDEYQMAVDFLVPDEQKEKYYTDLETMPPMKLQNAKESFLFAQVDETIYLIYDQTIYGSCREGFAITDKAIFWKSHFKQANQVYIADLKILEKQGSGLNINNLFFEIDAGINTRVFHYLKRVGEI